jgi:hypothetical protein
MLVLKKVLVGFKLKLKWFKQDLQVIADLCYFCVLLEAVHGPFDRERLLVHCSGALDY